MYPYRWNAYVIRTERSFQWSEIDLAAELLVAPKKYLVRLRKDDGSFGYLMEWAGGDLGWVSYFTIFGTPAHPRWPWGWAITLTKLPATGPP